MITSGEFIWIERIAIHDDRAPVLGRALLIGVWRSVEGVEKKFKFVYSMKQDTNILCPRRDGNISIYD